MRTRLFAVASVIGAALSVAAQPRSAQPIPYQLEFTAQVTRTVHLGLGPPLVESQRLGGGFQLRPTVGPLDWPTYLVEQVALTTTWTGGGPTEPVLMTGAGYYRRGGRGAQQESLTLALSVNGNPFEVTSGLVPAGDDWPALALTLNGSRSLNSGAGDREELEIQLDAVPSAPGTRHRLLPDSTFIDGCMVCGRPDIIEPIRGQFDVSLIDENPLFSRYAILDAQFESRDGDAIMRTIEGGGRYSIGGEVALLHPMRLNVAVDGRGVAREASLTNEPTGPFGIWPRIEEELSEEGGTVFSSFHVHLRSAPVRALWFTTSHGMTPGGLGPPGTHLEGGDLLDDSGRLVQSLAEMLRPLELATATVARLDALTVGPGGEFWFSLAEAVESARLGTIAEGDVVSDRGRRVFTNQELTRNLGIMPPVPDLGLDGLQVLPDGEVLFSLRQDAFSESLGTSVSHADIVSAKGTIVRRGKELLAPFEPKADIADIGLDAFYVWPNGDVWFSTATSFQSGRPEIGVVTDGDLLSSDGEVLYGNLGLVSAFEPLEDLANFGLTGLFVVTDLAVTDGPPTLKLAPSGTPGGWDVGWSSAGRVFQVETTSDLRLPFRERSPLGVAQSYRWRPVGAEFLRVRQW